LISKGYLPLTKSESIAHIDEHLKALDIPLSENDRAALDAFTPPGYTSPKIDWEKTGDGISIDQLSNVFDDDYNKQQAK
jgi:diketogulonate reductase-like aldo/keto reductase